MHSSESVEQVEPTHRAEPVGDPPAPSGVELALAEVGRVLSEIRDHLRAGHDRAAARERIIDRLHEENQKLRAGDRQLVLRPILVDLQQLRNELLREARSLPADFGRDQAADLLTSFADSAELALERGGATVVRPRPGAPFDPAGHRAARVVPAGTPAEDRTIEAVVSDGYHDVVGDRLLSPAVVVVRQWTPNGSAPVDAVSPAD
jgi:molecular chaperone GrpE